MLRRRAYGASYYGHGRDPSSRSGLSGYEQYTRATSNAEVAAYLLWRSLDYAKFGSLLGAGVLAAGVPVLLWARSSDAALQRQA